MSILRNKELGFFVLMATVCILVPSLALAQACNGPSGSCARPSYDPELVEGAVGNLFMLIEGSFGALIMVVSGIGAIISAAMGAYRAAVGMLVVALGSFILRALVTIFFGGGFTPIFDS